jgi:hypothetical protein
VAPLDGKGAAQGGKWNVRIEGGGVVAAAPAFQASPLVIPLEPTLCSPDTSPFAADAGPVARATTVMGELGIKARVQKHQACVVCSQRLLELQGIEI